MKFIEEDFGLANLGQRDSISQVGDLMDYFDLDQLPRSPLILNQLPASTTFLLPLVKQAPGAVSPTSGSSTVSYTFSTAYADAANQAPAQAQVYVDNTAYPMTYISGSYNTGALYQATLTLTSGKHTFYFIFSDSVSSWADPAAPSVYAGPNVNVAAAPIAPGAQITSSNEEDPGFSVDSNL